MTFSESKVVGFARCIRKVVFTNLVDFIKIVTIFITYNKEIFAHSVDKGEAREVEGSSCHPWLLEKRSPFFFLESFNLWRPFLIIALLSSDQDTNQFLV